MRNKNFTIRTAKDPRLIHIQREEFNHTVQLPRLNADHSGGTVSFPCTLAHITVSMPAFRILLKQPKRPLITPMVTIAGHYWLPLVPIRSNLGLCQEQSKHAQTILFFMAHAFPTELKVPCSFF